MQSAMLYVLQNSSYCSSEFYIAGTGIFDAFGSCDLDLHIQTKCENERLTLRLSKVMV